MKKKILICGATGFIGRNFINKFKLNDKYKIIAVYNNKKPIPTKNISWIKADLRKYKDCERVTKGIEIVLQFAATTSGSNVILNKPYVTIIIIVVDTVVIQQTKILVATENEFFALYFMVDNIYWC